MHLLIPLSVYSYLPPTVSADSAVCMCVAASKYDDDNLPTGLLVSKQVPEPKVTHINSHARTSTLNTYMTET